ncbi:MAG: spore cortex-lytic enzyme [Alicyclobacillus sp.]|nr:spore cortex-lytic enzyme [Alicyclobacillus sp.]
MMSTAAAVWMAVFSLEPAAAFTARDLMYGSRGYDVDELQNRLKYDGYYHGKVDGIFGWKTYWAVRNFQYNFGMKVTGYVDMATKMKLVAATQGWHYQPANSSGAGGSTGSNSGSDTTALAPVGNLSSSDLNLMAHTVYAEARGEPFEGQVAVAAVILNRLQSPKFPNTIPGIIYQPGAFTSVSDGQINLQPNAEAMKAVMDAVHGWDPSHGALYYFNPATATSSWIWSQPEITKIGDHIFLA